MSIFAYALIALALVIAYNAGALLWNYHQALEAGRRARTCHECHQHEATNSCEVPQ